MDATTENGADLRDSILVTASDMTVANKKHFAGKKVQRQKLGRDEEQRQTYSGWAHLKDSDRRKSLNASTNKRRYWDDCRSEQFGNSTTRCSCAFQLTTRLVNENGRTSTALKQREAVWRKRILDIMKIQA